MAVQAPLEMEKPPVKRLSINLPEPAFQDLERLKALSGRSMTDVVRTALSLVKIAFEEERIGNKLAVMNGKGRLLKEIVLP